MRSAGGYVWGTPANFNGFRVLASLLHRRRSLEANQTFHDVWPSPGLVHYWYTRIYIYIGQHFFVGGGLLPPDGILPGANFTLRPSLAFSCIGSISLLHGTRPAGVSQTLWRDTKNGVTELLQTAPPIFGRAAITLGRPTS